MIVDAIRKVVDRTDLTRDEAFAVMDAIMSGQATDAQIAAFLTALRMKGETVEELIGFARVMREKVSPVKTRARVQTSLSGTDREMLVDTCGTGGDATGTFNVSTATAFVVAGAGIPVAKHGNRSVSSLCGSADVVEALGVRLDLPPERVGRCVDEVGIGFCYAPLLHKAMKFVMLARREIRIRTVFNVLGPLTNPARATAQVIGVYDGTLAETMTRVLKELGTTRAYVVHGEDGLDELSTTGPSRVAELRDGQIRCYTVRPEDFGLPRAAMADLQGGSAADNAEIIRRILAGERGPKRDIVVLNAAAAIAAGGKAGDIAEGIAVAGSAIDSGAASAVLARLVEFCRG
jgi:anthranilate phosphoribosyltransferase